MFTPCHRRFLINLLSVASIAAFPSGASADHSWVNLHWARSANPFTLTLGDNLSTGWDGYLGTASDDWSASSVLDTVIAAGATDAKRCRPSKGTVQVCSRKYGNTGWLGVAQIWASGDHISQGTVKVNDTYFGVSPYNTPAWKNLVMCQEVGHAFGLDHQDEDFYNASLGTCMDYSTDPEPNQHPNAHDYEQLETIYGGHFDAAQAPSAARSRVQGGHAMPPAMTDIDLATPAQWGRLVASSHRGWTEVYELDFGHGHKVFTFVIWAE